jgi:CheY-like chemotaxis protein
MITVLLADDHPLIRKGFRLILDAESDIAVAGEAGDGATAVSMCSALRPDVVLMDVRMPGRDGIEATRDIVAAGLPSKVLILTTFDLDDYVYAGLRAGASGFLLTPGRSCPQGYRQGNHTPGNEMTFVDIDDAIARGPALVGSPQQIIDKIMYFHQAFGHDLQSFSLPTMVPHEQQMEMLGRLAAEVIPVIRKQAPTTLWTDQDPYGGRPAFAGRTVGDAASVIEEAGVAAEPLG